MKTGFYLRLAIDGMRKNRRLYLPYLLTCAGMVMVFYILTGLAYSPLMDSIRGGMTMKVILLLGTIVIAVFSLLFLFYTNSFLIRRRNREFGLYNILGMNKGDISRILLWETLLTALFALVVGLACGMLLSKLAELFLLHMADEKASYALHVEPKGLLAAVVFFGAIFAILLVVSLARVRLSKPLDLLKSEAAGEKPPKANWVFAVAGAIILGAAYYLAVTIRQPLTALAVFFIAVIMVIVATYLLFIAGSVALCKLLQKNRGYYYKAAHFVSVSSMAFRMKRNGAGLASICILATMVLVMLSSSGCLYFGGENAMRGIYPYELAISADSASPEDCTETLREWLLAVSREAAQGSESDLQIYTKLETGGMFRDGELEMERFYEDRSASELENVRTVYILPLSDYERLSGRSAALGADEALVWSSGKAYEGDTFAVKGCRKLRVAGTLSELPFRSEEYRSVTTSYAVFVPNWEEVASEIADCADSGQTGRGLATVTTVCGFDLPGLDGEEQIEIENRLIDIVEADMIDGTIPAEVASVSYKSRADGRSDFFSVYGSLFFIGVALSVVFIAAAALIIYYKQLSEGYEDQSRFDIMQKVGMTKREIRSTVNSQVRTVFFAPLIFAGVHLAFAFPFVQKIIRLFGVNNLPLLIVTSCLCFLVFAVFYVFVYRGTARTYYSIVSAVGERRAV